MEVWRRVQTEAGSSGDTFDSLARALSQQGPLCSYHHRLAAAAASSSRKKWNKSVVLFMRVGDERQLW